MNGVDQFKGDLGFGGSLDIPWSRSVMNSRLNRSRNLERTEVVACKSCLDLLLGIDAGNCMTPTISGKAGIKEKRIS